MRLLQQIDQAVTGIIPNVPPIFWSFRIMVALGLYFIALFSAAFYLSARRQFSRTWFLKLVFFSLPLPWISTQLGWFVAEYGRQPWAVAGALPTFLGTSSLNSSDVWISLIGFILFYSVLAVVECFLMVKYIRKGPEEIQYLQGAAR